MPPPPSYSPVTLAELLYYMTPFLAVMSFVLGAIWGSFLNVVIYRVPAGLSVVKPRSHCGACGTLVAWYDNIPIFSYFLLRGACRHCGALFSIRYAVVEFVTACLFLLVFLRLGPDPVVLIHWVIICLLIIGTCTDLDHYIIPDRVTLGGLVFALLVALLPLTALTIRAELVFTLDLLRAFDVVPPTALREPGIPLTFAFSLIGMAFGWALLTGVGLLGQLLFRKEGMGGGDIKLFAFLGAYFGPVACVVILFLSAFLGAIIGVAGLVRHKLAGQDEYDDLHLNPERLVTPDLSRAPEPAEATPEPPAGEPEAPAEPLITEPAPLTVHIPRRTLQQIHNLPYGPYIALAALIVLLWGDFLRYSLANSIVFMNIPPAPVLFQAFEPLTIPAVEAFRR